MKTLFVVLLSFFAMASAHAKTIKITAKGMVCGFCAQGVVKKFKEESAVSKVDVSLEKQLVTIELKDGQSLDNKKIESLMTYSGYDVEKIERPD